MKCPSCEFNNPEGAKSCGECGTKLQLLCPRCGNATPPGSEFCNQCGSPLEGKVEKTRPIIEAERKQITVLFSDLSGYTAMTEKLDPEEVKEIKDRIFGEIAQVVAKYEGWVHQSIGDEAMILFGVPRVHEDDPFRAIRAAQEIHARIEALSPQFEKRIGRPLAMHSGIHTGLVLTGELDLQKGVYGEMTGDTINLAARLSDLAKAGEIWVGPETCRRTQGTFSFQALAPTQVKGKAGSIQVYKVLSGTEGSAATHTVAGLRARSGRVLGMEMHGIGSPLVGREEEVSLLRDHIQRLLSGRGGLVLVSGEAGLGKSRLMTEVRSQWKEGRQSGALWLEGRALSFTQTMSYWPFQEILREYAEISEEDEEEGAWSKVEASITSLFPPSPEVDDLRADEVLPYVASMLALRVKGELEERVRYLDGEAMGRQIFLTSRRLFQRLAQQCPLILVFEDWQWADQSSADLLEHLLPLIQIVPLLICVVSRPDLESPAMRLRGIAAREYPDHYTEIAVDALPPMESEKLLHNLLETKDLSPHLRKTILHKAEGNPFFLEEVIRALVSMGAIVREAGKGSWKATARIENVRIPDTLQGVIMARVDRLEEEVKQILRLASVVGRIFLYRVLQAIAEADRDLDHHLDELQRVELIREKSRIPELEYIFKHALIQEATYESILLKRRRELHAQVGQCLETLFADRLEEFYGLLAYHYARAENWEKAQEYLFKTGDQAGRLAADAEALEHYRQAEEAYTRAFGDRWDPLQRAILERKIGEALFRRGDHHRALEYLQRGLTILGKPLPTSRWGIRRAIMRQVLRQIGHRLLPALFIRGRIGQNDPMAMELFRFYEVITWIDYFEDLERMLLGGLMALNLSERSGYTAGVASGLAVVGLLCDQIIGFRLASYYHRLAMDLAEQVRHPMSIGHVNFLSSWPHARQGRWEIALERLGRAESAYREAGSLRGCATVAATRGYSVHAFRGEFAALRKDAYKALQIGQEAADQQAYAWGMQYQGKVLCHTGSLDDAIASVQKAIELFEAMPDYAGVSQASTLLGDCYLRQGQVDFALDILERSNQIIKEKHFRGWQITEARHNLAEAYLRKAEQTKGAEKVQQLKKAKWACRLALKQGKFIRPGLPHARRLQGTYEWLRGRPASAHKWWQRSLSLAEELGNQYDLGKTCLEIGMRMQDRSYLKRAERVFYETGVNLELARVQELLRGKETS